MENFIEKFDPVDIIAIITILGGLILVGFGINGLVGTMLTAITFFYFGGKDKLIDNIENDKRDNDKQN